VTPGEQKGYCGPSLEEMMVMDDSKLPVDWVCGKCYLALKRSHIFPRIFVDGLWHYKDNGRK